MAANLRRGGDASTYFPDQPIRLSFGRIGNGRVLVVLEAGNERRAASAFEDELIATLRQQGVAFFEQMSQLVPGNRSSYEDAARRLAQL